MRKVACGIVAWVALMSPAKAAETFKIGFVTTLTTPSAVIGRDMVDALNLAAEHAGGTILGRKIELLIEDDGTKPDLGRQKAEKLVRQDNVDVVAGFIWSNVFAASRKPVIDAGKILITTNAVTNDTAGKSCNPHIFATRGEAEVFAAAIGAEMTKAGVKKLYTMGPNYIAGKDFTSGAERAFKGEVVGHDLTKWGDDPQLDFSAEFSKAKASGADALFAFYPGRASGAFARQFEQAGLAPAVKLFTLFTIDQLALPALQAANVKAVLGSHMADFWSPTLPNAANKRFVADFKARYGRYPSNYAASTYDLIPFVKAAIEQAGSFPRDATEFRKDLRAAHFDSVRGKFNLGPNQIPVDDYYDVEVEVDSQGTWTLVSKSKVLENAVDPYAADCKMPQD